MCDIIAQEIQPAKLIMEATTGQLSSLCSVLHNILDSSYTMEALLNNPLPFSSQPHLLLHGQGAAILSSKHPVSLPGFSPSSS